MDKYLIIGLAVFCTFLVPGHFRPSGHSNSHQAPHPQHHPPPEPPRIPGHDCIVSVWTNWTNCMLNTNDPDFFGLSTRSRQRYVIYPAYGGRPCPQTVEKQICFSLGGCVLSEWSSFGPCINFDGVAISERHRIVLVPALVPGWCNPVKSQVLLGCRPGHPVPTVFDPARLLSFDGTSQPMIPSLSSFGGVDFNSLGQPKRKKEKKKKKCKKKKKKNSSNSSNSSGSSDSSDSSDSSGSDSNSSSESDNQSCIERSPSRDRSSSSIRNRGNSSSGGSSSDSD